MMTPCYHEFMNWTIEQRWSHVLFVNWKVPASVLQAQVPFPLDLHDGQAVLSLVPFFMDRVRFRGLPSIPVASRLWEVNLRTYVKVNGVPGIYFFTLETPHRLANLIARRFFSLPYRFARVAAAVSQSDYELEVHGMDAMHSPYLLRLRASAEAGEAASDFQRWVTERYHLFVRQGERVLRGDVFHDPWKVRNARVSILEGGISVVPNLPGITKLEPCFWADPLKVRFAPFSPQSSFES